MLEIYIARHGQTEWNREGRLQGWLNSALTDQGVESAEILGREIDHIQFDAYYSSPSERAYKTLEIALSPMKPEIVTDERLMEMGLGEWQGKLMSEIRRDYKTAFDDYFHKPERFSLLGAESYYDVKDRVDHFINELVKVHFHHARPKKVLVITHGVTLMMMRLLFNGGDIKDLASYGVADNAKLHVYQFDGSRFHSMVEEHENFDAR
ncbi:MAG: hypothetical protein PWP51_2962 [Clostridiales bacterium]|jgi:probable phosphoglycerate mutase|nr:hypothetical protein [Clostridiales bacterium]MDN5300409.1 hypothetical protein [Clostridiales bacterium]